MLAVATILLATTMLNRTKNSRAYVAALFPLPNIIGCILVLTLPWSNKVGLLVAFDITGALLRSTQTLAFSIESRSCRDTCLCHSTWLGDFYNCRAHQTNYCECHNSNRVLCRFVSALHKLFFESELSGSTQVMSLDHKCFKRYAFVSFLTLVDLPDNRFWVARNICPGITCPSVSSSRATPYLLFYP